MGWTDRPDLLAKRIANEETKRLKRRIWNKEYQLQYYQANKGELNRKRRERYADNKSSKQIVEKSEDAE